MKSILGVALLAATVFLIAMSSPSIYGLLVSSITLSNVGTVTTIGVGAYWDSDCTSEISTIDWGNIQPGSTENVVVYLKNQGNSPITLSLNATNWNPSSASSYISVGWSYSGQQISPGNVIQVTLSLTVSSSISGVSSFTVDIVITATG